MSRLPLLVLATAVLRALARDIPENVQDFYDANIGGDCANPLSDAFTDGQTSTANIVYCSDASTGAVYLKGPDGTYDDMDIDCDGLNASEGLCNNDPSGQSQTAFQSEVQEFGIADLDAHVHPYVVLGNEGEDPSFDPQSAGIQPLSVVAVVCNGQLIYGVWGDTNGGTSTGEASLALGQLCFGDDAVSGDNGHTEHDILYIAFPGDDAVPGSGADWTAATKEDFESSIQELGDSLVAGLGAEGQREVVGTKFESSQDEHSSNELES
ncbi:glycoside hydrolase family 75 protein [Cenococcum geophilum]